jgi:ribosomal protein S18 acetylase RimI-like enzyme
VSARSFSTVRENEHARALSTLVSAFTDDPVERWLYPEAHKYLTRFPQFLAAFGGKAFDKDTVWSLRDFAAVAMWLPPGTEPEGNTITTVLTGSVSPEKHDDLFSVLRQMDSAHPQYPHWYLPWFGVKTGLQGEGLGGVLMTHCLEIVDATHLPAYLETPNPRNLSFYERHGFEVTATAQAGTCPPVTSMLRAARPT